MKRPRGFKAATFPTQSHEQKHEEIMDNIEKLRREHRENTGTEPDVLRIQPGLLSDGQVRRLEADGVRVEQGKRRWRLKPKHWRQG